MIDMNALYQIGYGLFVVTTRNGKRDNGFISNAFMQVALTPPWLCLSVSKANFSCETIQKTGEFCASILTESVPFDIFRRFGFQSGRTLNKFANFPDVKRAENGLLYLTTELQRLYFRQGARGKGLRLAHGVSVRHHRGADPEQGSEPHLRLLLQEY